MQTAKLGSGLADIITTANYPASCTNRKTCNQPVWTKDAKGNQTDYTYNATYGVVATITAPAPSAGAVRPQARYTYVTVNGMYVPSKVAVCRTLATCTSSVDGLTTTLAYGTAAQNYLPIKKTVIAGDSSVSSVTTIAYDNISNVSTIDGPLSGTTDTTKARYDASRRIVGIIGPDPDGAGVLKNRAVRLTYNADWQTTLAERGTVNSQSDADWAAFASLQQLVSAYDGNARKTSDALQSGGATYSVTQYSYDNIGRLDCSAVRMNGAAWGSLPASACTAQATGSFGPDRIVKTGYDATSRLVKSTSAFGTGDQADDSTVTFTANGAAATMTDANGNVTGYIYDGFDRLSETHFPLPASPGSYSSTDYEGYIYDINGNITYKRLRDGQAINFTFDNLNRLTLKDLPAGENDVSYAYDLQGRILSLTRPDISQTFSYDGLGRLSQEAQPFGSMAYVYDAAGRRTKATWNDGFFVNYDYFVTNEVKAIRENGATTGVGVLGQYAYDNLGRRITLTRSNGTSTTYGYDAASRLSSLFHNFAGTVSDVTTTFAYNPAGQIVSQTRDNDAFRWTGQTARNLTETPNGLNQLTAQGGTALNYDGRGNVSSIGSQAYGHTSENQLKSGPATLLYYDASGRLVEYDTTISTRFVYDGSNIASEVDGSGAITRRYVWGPGFDEPLVWYVGNGTDRRYLYQDERSSVIGVSDGTGNATGVNSYDEYGVPASGNVGRFQYTGQAWLAELGQNYYKTRFFAPGLGRFLQTDPIGFKGGQNLYAYVAGDPVNFTDPLGLAVVIINPNVKPVDGGTLVVTGHRLPKENPDSRPLDVSQSIVTLSNIGDLAGGGGNGNSSSDDTHPCQPTPGQLAASGAVHFRFVEAGGSRGVTATRATGAFRTDGGYSGKFTTVSTGGAFGKPGVVDAVGSGTSKNLATFSGDNYNITGTLAYVSISDNYSTDLQHVGETDAANNPGLSLGATKSTTVLREVQCPN